MIDVPWEKVEASMLTPYRCAVRRAVDPDLSNPETEYYPMPLRERLSTIRVPLRVGENDVALDLQAPIDRAYLEGRYDLRLRYSDSPMPPLAPDDAAWAAGRIAAAR